MKFTMPKINWEKVGAYAFGSLLGGGLSALAWHAAEKHGLNPAGIFRKKVVEGNLSYYDPEKDPNLADMTQELEGLDVLEEEYEDDDISDGINEPAELAIYPIDRETWYRSEDDDGYKHAEIKYWIDDQKCSDENDVLIPKPWLLIGEDIYDSLADEDCDRELFVRNEELETDYLVVRTDGSFDE